MRKRTLHYGIRVEGDGYGEPADVSLEAIIGGKVQPDPVTGCWQWTGSKDAAGYGMHWRVGRVHRWVYELLVNPIPDGFVVHHECENKACVNPDHLRASTQRDHSLHHNPPGMAARARKTA